MDKDPFTNIDERPKDYITTSGFLTRHLARSSSIMYYLPIYLIVILIPLLAANSGIGVIACVIHAIYKIASRFQDYLEWFNTVVVLWKTLINYFYFNKIWWVKLKKN